MSAAFGSKASIATPPDKGSFPLDHAGECKSSMKTFLNCMKKHSNNHMDCKAFSRAYLSCRIEKGLMQKEDLDNMGMNLNEHTPDRAPSIEGRKEEEGFISGLGVKEKRY